MKFRFDSFLLHTSAALILTLGASGCARNAGESSVPPDGATAPAEHTPSLTEARPAAVNPPDLDPAFFDFDSHVLNGSGRQVLDQTARLMRAGPELELTIEGHCDERGTSEYNMALGERRANAARDYLLAAGIESERLTVISYGEERPLDRSHDEAAWAKNRRANLIVGN